MCVLFGDTEWNKWLMDLTLLDYIAIPSILNARALRYYCNSNIISS